MQRYARGLSVAAVLLALGAFFLATAHGRDDDDKEKAKKTAAAKEAVLKLIGDIGGKDADVEKEAADVAAKHEIEFVMNQFKPREKGGLGVGAKAGAILPDAIELKLIALGNPKKMITKADLTSQKADLQKMAETSLAIAEIAPHYAPKKDEPGAPIKDWLKFSEDMKKQSKDLVGAVKSGDPKMVQKASLTLNSSCNACHTEFRDK